MAPSQTISKIVASLPECIAAGFVDVRSGMLLDMRTADQQPTDVVDLAAAAIADLFQGQNALAIEEMFRKSTGEQGGQVYFREILMTSDNLVYVFLRSRKNPDYVAVFVCRSVASLGMVLAKARMALPAFEASL